MASYAQALEPVLRTLQRGRDGVSWSAPVRAGEFELTFESGDRDPALREIDPGTRVIAARTVRVRHADHRSATAGFGLAVVMVGEPEPGGATAGPFVPSNGRYLPATFVIDFSQPGKPRARFYNTHFSHTAAVGGRELPLATDFTAGLELGLGAGALRAYAFRGLFLPGDAMQQSGLFFTEPFDANRIPVIMVHGIASDPHIWQNVMNEVLDDPVLRRSFQLWYFKYPSGLPMPTAAQHLRESIDSAFDTHDPGRRNPVLNQSVLLGHSMGGLLSRMQVIDSGDDLWKSMFNVSPEQLDVSVETRESLRRSLFFAHRPEVDRVVFIATPHRGSEFADRWLVRWAVRLIRLPIGLAAATADFARLDPSVLNPLLRSFDAFGARSV
jgi:pimeloyl-ACP methyl ester carboxylesterase